MRDSTGNGRGSPKLIHEERCCCRRRPAAGASVLGRRRAARKLVIAGVSSQSRNGRCDSRRDSRRGIKLIVFFCGKETKRTKRTVPTSWLLWIDCIHLSWQPANIDSLKSPFQLSPSFSFSSSIFYFTDFVFSFLSFLSFLFFPSFPFDFYFPFISLFFFKKKESKHQFQELAEERATELFEAAR